MREDFGLEETDCFAYCTKNVKPSCSVLTSMMCKKGECKFYKTMEQFYDGLKKLSKIRQQNGQPEEYPEWEDK
ncbi:MAG: hypothetical protein J6T10_32500 [Methanobrevibacter sp.]|nr:hypothetical protein [Methanobrevibacter sp.]